MAKTQSLSDRTRFYPVKIATEMASEIPVNVIKDTGLFGYYGSSCFMDAVNSRRTKLNISSDEKNTVAIENDKYFENMMKMTSPTSAKFYQIDYKDYISGKTMIKETPKFRLDNKPYNYEGQGNARMWDDIVKRDNSSGVLDWQGDILPNSLLRSNDLSEMRETYFNDYGLYKVRPLSFDTFTEYGAKVATCIYYCKKGYTGPITVQTDVSTYEYDFKKLGFIVTPDTKKEVDFILNCLNMEGYIWKGVKLKERFFNSKSKEILNSKLFSLTKDNTYKYPVVIKLNKDGTHELGYTSEIVDSESIKHDKIVTPYQCSSYASGGSDLGNVVFIPKGVQLSGSYRWTEVIGNGDAEISYLQSRPIKYLLQEWRTSQTNDGPQLQIIPKLTDHNVQTEDDILTFLGGMDIKQEIINGYTRKNIS